MKARARLRAAIGQCERPARSERRADAPVRRFARKARNPLTIAFAGESDRPWLSQRRPSARPGSGEEEGRVAVGSWLCFCAASGTCCARGEARHVDSPRQYLHMHTLSCGRRRRELARTLRLGAAVMLLTVCAWGLVCPRTARADAVPACASRSVRPLLESPEGAAGQAVVFIAVRNSGVACHLRAVLSFAVLENGHLATVRENPLSYRVHRDLGHGKTVLFDVWWSNWCGSRRGSRFTARVSLGHSRAVSRYPLLPVCLSRVSGSRLTARSQ